MSKILGTVNDRSSIVIKVGARNPEGALIEVLNGTWTLVNQRDPDDVINNRENIPLPTRNVDGFYYIGLTDADVAFVDGENRYLVIKGQYFNSLVDSFLDLVSWTTFKIHDVRYIV